MNIATTGIVVREKTIGEDRLVYILTRDYGLISAFARGAKKPRGKLTSSTELLCYSRITLFWGRDSYTVDSADCECSFFELRRDLNALALASYIADVACELSPREEAAPRQLSLVLNTLHLLKEGKKSHALLKAVYELKMASLAGFMPDLVACCTCGAYTSNPMFFQLEEGVLFCAACVPKERACVALPESVLAALRHILYVEPKKLFSFQLSAEGLRLLGQVCEQYILSHAERGFKALQFYKSLEEDASTQGL